MWMTMGLTDTMECIAALIFKLGTSPPILRLLYLPGRICFEHPVPYQ